MQTLSQLPEEGQKDIARSLGYMGKKVGFPAFLQANPKAAKEYQDLEDAFKAEGLDASKYAMFCSDTWWEKEITVDAVKADKEKGVEAKDAYTYTDTKDEATEGYTEKTRLGVRYSELLAFIISAI